MWCVRVRVEISHNVGHTPLLFAPPPTPPQYQQHLVHHVHPAIVPHLSALCPAFAAVGRGQRPASDSHQPYFQPLVPADLCNERPSSEGKRNGNPIYSAVYQLHCGTLSSRSQPRFIVFKMMTAIAVTSVNTQKKKKENGGGRIRK